MKLEALKCPSCSADLTLHRDVQFCRCEHCGTQYAIRWTEQNGYTLTVVSANGTVTRSPDKASYTYNEVVQLTATPAVGYSFANWSGDASGSTNPVSVTMDGNKNVTANFTQNTYTLTVTSDHGTVTPDLPAPYHYGDVVHLTAVPSSGWTFEQWSGDASGPANPVAITMDGNKAVTAHYVQNGYTLAISSEHGMVAKAPDKASYTYGEIVQLTVTPAAGWEFANWTGDASGSDNPLSLTMDANKSVTANYAAIAVGPSTLTAQSIAEHDGWILESGEFSSLGGTKNVKGTTFLLGDDASNHQYRAILSFDTTLPANAVITNVTLRILQSGAAKGASPFLKLGNLVVDIKNGSFSKTVLQVTDFSAKPTGKAALVIPNSPVSGWYTGTLGAGAAGLINKAGITQFRLRFSKDDNNNRVANFVKFYSGNYADPSYRPTLIITYTVP